MRHRMNAVVTGATGAVPNQGMNQMLELFKMQYLMKMFEGNKSAGGGMFMMFLLMAYDHFAKSFPALVAFLWLWAQSKWTGKPMYPELKNNTPLMPVQQQPPPTKTVQAFIQFERHPEKAADPRIDAVMFHVCTLPDVRSLRYNGVEMIPNFKDQLMIENDVWFEILSSTNGPPMVTTVNPGGKTGTVEPILYRLSTYDHDITWLHKFVEQAMETFEQEKKNKLGSETYYFDQVASGSDSFRTPLPKGLCMFNKSKFQSNRTLKNVYLRQIEDLQGRVEFFMRRRDWYDSKGIPHTLGIVMYGHPGCGKTSTIKAVANETKRHIFNIMLSEIRTKEALKDLFYNEQVHVWGDNSKMEVLNIPLKNRLYVIEDIDAMDSVVVKRSKEAQKEEEERKIRIAAEMELLKQQQGETLAKAMINGKKGDETDKLDLATLLNVLDGVRETPGRIIILSTNYPERLDEALLRPGRFDMMLEFEKHSCTVLQQHIEKHYDLTLTPQQLAKVHDPSLNYKWTPAEVSQILFRRHTDPDAAIEDLLKESPEKLFKFSQMKNSFGNASEGTPKVEETVQEKPIEEASTSLEDLLKQEVIESSSSNELVSLSSDDDMAPISGGINLTNPDPPTPQQVEAELKTHKELFPEQYKDGKYTGIVNLHPSNANTGPERAVVLQVQKKVLEETTIARNTLIEQYKQEIQQKQPEGTSSSTEEERLKQIAEARVFMENSFKMEEFNPANHPNAGNSEHADRTMLDHMMQSPMFCDDGTGLCAATDFTDGPTMLEECFGSTCESSGLEASFKT